jgi:hypothetical protein
LEESAGETVFGKDNIIKKAAEAVSSVWNKFTDFFSKNPSGRAVADVAKPVIKDTVEVGAAGVEAAIKHDPASLKKLDQVVGQKVMDVPEGIAHAVSNPRQTLLQVWNPSESLQYNLTKAAVFVVPLALSRGKSLAADETQVILREGQYINRVWDSRWTPGSSYSGPFGGSYSPGGVIPINAATAIETRGLNIPGVLNNAERGGVYSVTRNIPATFRTSISGTEPELSIAPEFRQHLNLIDQSISVANHKGREVE